MQVFIANERKFLTGIEPALGADHLTIQRALDSYSRKLPDFPSIIEYQEGDYRLLYFCHDKLQVSIFQLRQQATATAAEIFKAQCKT